jgi:hypothetical protein
MDHTRLLQGLPEDRCQCPHWGYVLEGRLTFQVADGEEIVEAGCAYTCRPATYRWEMIRTGEIRTET